MADVTPTPTPCTCEEHQVTIIQSDLDSASGNTDSNLDGVVFWITTNCSGVYEEIPFYDAGVFDGFCVCQETSFYYWKDNSAIQGYSFADPIGPCNPATPTQTPTLPESPTQTPTPSTTPPVTYYYYSGLLCGAVSFLKYFRSTNPNLADHCPVVYAWCDTCGGGSYQCFDNISPSAVYNTNDVIECYETCECCQGLCPTPTQTETLPLTPTQTETPPSTPTQTPTPSITASPTQTPTPSITASPTQTPTPSITASQTQTQTQTPTPSITASQTQTQTQTSSPTPSTTPCVEGCVEYVNVNVTFAGTIAYLDCNGVTQYQSVSVGAQSVGVGTCVNKDSLAGSAAFTVVLNGPCCGVIPATPSQTPTNTITPTQTPTITASPTQSPTNTPTTTPTTTITATPSSTPLVCGSGYTTGNHYYYDCCGNLVTGSGIEILVALDYTKPYVGIVLLNEPASVLCATPTNTPTQSATPTPSITPSVTPSPTLTPTITPTTSMTPSSPEVYVRENNCEVVTIFPMGIQCNVVNPNTSTSQDGVVSLIITGGSAPYTITWDNGQIGQTLVGMQQGSYGVTVVDFYGDYTANTVCSIFAPSPTPTASVTVTPTMTPSPVYPNLCFFVDYGVGAVIGPLQFNWIGSFNGKPQWSYFNGVTTTYLRWNIELSRWQMYDWTSTGTLVSFVTTNIPTTGWQSEGNPQQAVVTVTEGTCPQSAPLTIRITTDPTTCGDVAPYDGGITISAVGGTAPYTYSIDNGQTFSSANVFSQLRNGNYTVVVRDSAGSTISRQATVTADYSTVSYQVYVNTSGVTQISEYNYQSSWCVEVNPPLPVGVTLSFDLSVSESKIIDQPGSGVSVPSTTVKKNDVAVTTTNITTSDNTTTRPNCDPYTRFEENRTALYPLTMQRGDIISGTSVSLITLTTPEIGPNGCATRVEQNTVVFAQSPILTNCNCCDISNLKVYGGIPRHIVQYSNSGGGQAPPTVNTSYLSVPGSNICDVCSLRRIPTPVFNYDNTISVGTVFYTVNTEGVLSSPLNGGFSYYKIFWGGSEPTDYDVVQIDDNGVITSLVDCQTECFTYFEFPGSVWGPNTGSLYSNCNPLSFGPLCVVYENTSGTPLLGYPYIFINNMNYDINPETGYVIGISPIQQ